MDNPEVTRALLRITRAHVAASHDSIRSGKSCMFLTFEALRSSQIRIQESDRILACWHRTMSHLPEDR